MITNLQNALRNTFLLHVGSKPVQTSRSWIEKDEDGNEVGEKRSWTEETVTGTLLTNLLNPHQPTNVEVSIRSTQMHNLVEGAPNYGDILEAYLEDKKAFIAGEKLMEIETLQMPRINRSGDKAGIATSFTPVLVGFKVVDAKPEDVKFIEALTSLENNNSVEATMEESNDEPEVLTA